MAQANPTQAIANIYRTPELWEKIVFTFLCLVVYRVGSHVAVPGVNVSAMVDFFKSQQGGGLLGLYDLFVGGNLSRSTIFALGIMPYISASIFAQIAGAVIPQVEKMQKDEEAGRRSRSTHATRPSASRSCRHGGTGCSPRACRARWRRPVSASRRKWRSS